MRSERKPPGEYGNNPFHWLWEMEGLQDRTRKAMHTILKELATGRNVGDALEKAGKSRSIYDTWRKTYPTFGKETQRLTEANEYARRAANFARKQARQQAEGLLFDPDRKLPEREGFADFRMRFFGRPTPPHQEPMVEALEDRTNLVVFILAPAGSGKDTICQDWIMYEHSDDRGGLRSAFFMPSEGKAMERIQRIGRYLSDERSYESTPDKTPGGAKPKGNLIKEFGPFRWNKEMVLPNGAKVEREPWNQHKIYLLGSVAPENDPNLWATGLQGTTHGARIDNAVITDIFTPQNQQSPAEREAQWLWLTATLDTRLDEAGRMIVIGNMLPIENNYERMLNEWMGDATPIHTNGYYTKYSNGWAVVVIPAIQEDPDTGEEVSYWPERFPLEPAFLLTTGEVVAVPAATDQMEFLRNHPRTKRWRGLVERRRDNAAVFDALYQQHRDSNASSVDFPAEVLAAARDETRTYRVAYPNEVILLGVDPAKVYGAAWVAWAVDPQAGIATVLDWEWHEHLGVAGMKERLVTVPVTRFSPRVRWLIYEANKDDGVFEDAVIVETLNALGVERIPHWTHTNRADLEVGVGSLAMYMMSHQIRFPYKTDADKEKTTNLEKFFANYDSRSMGEGRLRPGHPQYKPDDTVMAAWIGFTRAVKLWQANIPLELPSMPVPASVKARWEKARMRKVLNKRHYADGANNPASRMRAPTPTLQDIMAAMSDK